MSNFTNRSDFGIQFSNRLVTRRKECQLSQERLADMIGVQRETISKYEQGRTIPDLLFLINASKALNCSYEYLLGESDYIKPQYKDIEEMLGLSKTSIVTLEQLTMVLRSNYVGRPDLIDTINKLIESTGYNEHYRKDNETIASTGRVFSPGLLNMIDDYLLYDADSASFSIQNMMRGKQITRNVEVNADTVSNILLLDINKFLVDMREDEEYKIRRSEKRTEHNLNQKRVKRSRQKEKQND